MKCQKKERAARQMRNETSTAATFESCLATKNIVQSHQSADLKSMQRKKEKRKKPLGKGNQALQKQILEQIYGNQTPMVTPDFAQNPQLLTQDAINSGIAASLLAEIQARINTDQGCNLAKPRLSEYTTLQKLDMTALEHMTDNNLQALIREMQHNLAESLSKCQPATTTKTPTTITTGTTKTTSPYCNSKSMHELNSPQSAVLKQTSSASTSALLNSKAKSCARLNSNGSAACDNTLVLDRTNGASHTKIGEPPAAAMPFKRKQKSVKVQHTEQKALTNYINEMVSGYFSELGCKHKLDKLKFNGGVINLEGYAQRLVRAGVGRIVEEKIRIYCRNNQLAFITLYDGKRQLRDAIITQRVARRYAFEGDVVRAFVLHTKKQLPAAKQSVSIGLFDESLDDGVESVIPKQCSKAFAIRIVQQPPQRQVVGILCIKNTKMLYGVRHYILRPQDLRLPLLYVPQIWCNIASNATDAELKSKKYYYLVKVVETTENGMCIGRLVKCLGVVGNIASEIRAILASNGLHHIKPYEQHFSDMYAALEHEPISAADLKRRMDLRDLCVFSIDPVNAQDIDDALSLELINDQRIVVGVHIADVSKYLLEDTALDMQVRERATSIYLGNEVIHMLPEGLCKKCSLLAGKERFVLSVFFVFDVNGQPIGRPKFMRSIIKSCAQLTYEQAQLIIDQTYTLRSLQDDSHMPAFSLPNISGQHQPQHIIKRVKFLHAIAQKLRRQRYANGALSISNPKLQFQLDDKTGEPLSFQLEQKQAANFLIEEFMLLANQAVARLIHTEFPNTAILRAHSPPLLRPLYAIRDRLAVYGLHLDCSNAGSIYESLQRICNDSSDPEAVLVCISSWLIKPMVRAVYLCSDGKLPEDLQHFALNIPIYTHFTSPIRRYADIMVHRLVVAALDLAPEPKRQPAELQMLAEICNVQKYNAKCAASDTDNLLFKRYIQANQSIQMQAVVVELLKRSLNVLLIETGHLVSVYYDQQPFNIDKTGLPEYLNAVDLDGLIAAEPIKLEVFSKLHVDVQVCDNKLQGFLRPRASVNTIIPTTTSQHSLEKQ